MSNITYTYVTFAQLQPIFTMNGLHHSGGIPYHTANDTENVLLLIEDHNYEYAAYKYRTTSTVILMVFAWILLIVGFTICCCAQCFRDRGKSKERVRGENVENTNGIDDDRTNPNEPVEICRHYGPDFEAESLPSYTIVSGLPTYDDALDEFRKAGIILSPSMPVVKLFERDLKENQIYNLENGGTTTGGGLMSDGDNISLSSTCTCGANNSNTITQNNNINNNTANTGNFNLTNMGQQPQVIELSPEQLASLSQKRLSLQIAFNSSVRRNSRPRIDLYRQANRNNLIRSQRSGLAGVGTMGVGGGVGGLFDGIPQVHRSSSTLSLSNEPNMLLDSRRLQHLQHRGSLC